MYTDDDGSDALRERVLEKFDEYQKKSDEDRLRLLQEQMDAAHRAKAAKLARIRHLTRLKIAGIRATVKVQELKLKQDEEEGEGEGAFAGADEGGGGRGVVAVAKTAVVVSAEKDGGCSASVSGRARQSSVLLALLGKCEALALENRKKLREKNKLKISAARNSSAPVDNQVQSRYIASPGPKILTSMKGMKGATSDSVPATRKTTLNGTLKDVSECRSAAAADSSVSDGSVSNGSVAASSNALVTEALTNDERDSRPLHPKYSTVARATVALLTSAHVNDRLHGADSHTKDTGVLAKNVLEKIESAFFVRQNREAGSDRDTESRMEYEGKVVEEEEEDEGDDDDDDDSCTSDSMDSASRAGAVVQAPRSLALGRSTLAGLPKTGSLYRVPALAAVPEDLSDDCGESTSSVLAQY